MKFKEKVWRACARVPCHRVVKASGELDGFALGSTEKKKLLEREGVRVTNGKIKDFRKKFYRLKSQQ